MIASRTASILGKLLLVALTLASLAARPVRADVSIVANFGPYPSAEVAGQAEAQVNWLDADPRDDTVCTESFAVLELQHYLREMTGRKHDFAIVAAQKVPEQGELIVVGSPASNAAAAKLATALE